MEVIVPKTVNEFLRSEKQPVSECRILQWRNLNRPFLPERKFDKKTGVSSYGGRLSSQ